MKTLKELQDAFSAKQAKLKPLSEKGADMTIEDAREGKTLRDEMLTIVADIKTLVDAQNLTSDVKQFDTLMNTGAGFKHGQAAAQVVDTRFAGITEYAKDKEGKVAWMTQSGEMLLDEKTLATIASTSYKEAWSRYLRNGDRNLGETAYKTLIDGADTAGGFLVPEEMLNKIFEKKPTPTRVKDFVTTLNTSRDSLSIPRVNYTADDLYTTGMRVTWTGEQPNSDTQARVNFPDATTPNTNGFGLVRIPVFTAMMSLDVSNDQIEDSMFPLMSWVSDKFSQTRDLLYDNMALNGAGGNQPTGMLFNPGGTFQPAFVAAGNPITAVGLVDVAYSLPEQYEDGAMWVFNKTNTAKYIRTLQDGNGRVMFGVGYQDSGLAYEKPRNLIGYDFAYSGFAPNTGANNFPLIFGDLKGYSIVERVGFSIQVLNERYAEQNKRVMLGRIRIGGQTTEEWSIKIGKQA